MTQEKYIEFLGNLQQQATIQNNNEKIEVFANDQWDNRLQQWNNELNEKKNEIKESISILIQMLSQEQLTKQSQNERWIDLENPNKGFLKRMQIDLNIAYLMYLYDIYSFSYDIENKQLRKFVTDIISKYKKIPRIMIDQLIIFLFEVFFQIENQALKITKKKNGVQFGRIITVHSNLFTQTYYAKTHSRGYKEADESRKLSKTVDLRELFVYKVLEFTQFGVESHFISYDEWNLYIITKEAISYSNCKIPKQKKLSELIDKKEVEVQNEVEDIKKLNSIVKAIMDADIFQRIFQISDVLQNDENLIFINTLNKDNDEKWSLKIIDFLVMYQIEDSGQHHLFNLRSGNGNFLYKINKNPILSHYLGTENLRERIENAKLFNFVNIKNAIDQAHLFIKSRFNFLKIQDPEQIKIFNIYIKMVQKGVRQFEQQINELILNDLQISKQ